MFGISSQSWQETLFWRVSPPYGSWQCYASGIQKHAMCTAIAWIMNCLQRQWHVRLAEEMQNQKEQLQQHMMGTPFTMVNPRTVNWQSLYAFFSCGHVPLVPNNFLPPMFPYCSWLVFALTLSTKRTHSRWVSTCFVLRPNHLGSSSNTMFPSLSWYTHSSISFATPPLTIAV